MENPMPWSSKLPTEANEETQTDKIGQFYYVGDMPDDMIAASLSRANFFGIGILISSSGKVSLKKDLLQAGAEHIVDDFNELKKIIEFL
jgi:phosphoglycolate phosphatase-like HAD superfamily hydrolase